MVKVERSRSVSKKSTYGAIEYTDSGSTTADDSRIFGGLRGKCSDTSNTISRHKFTGLHGIFLSLSHKGMKYVFHQK